MRRSEPNRGSGRLGGKHPPGPAPAPAASTSVGADRVPVVLVVDDEADFRWFCCAALEAYGYHPIPAADGAQAVELFARADPEISLVLTDLSMPNMDGPTAIRSIRRMSPGVPIVAMSGLAEEFRAQGIERLGLVAILEKPFGVEEMLAMLGEALGPVPRD